MYILGISCYYHDSSAALLKDGVVVCAAQEERFTRKKHDTSFPKEAINYCISSQKITINEIDYIGFYEKPLIKFERVLSQHLEMFPRSLKTFLSSTPSWINEKLRVMKAIKKLKYKKDVLFIEHHLAHAAGSFLLSPFKKSAIVTIDGVGEWTTTSYGIGEDSDITLKKEIRFPSSLGLFYSTITAYLGFTVNNSEYKVMGLCPYGEMDKEKNPYYLKLIQVIDLKEDGSFRLDMSYFKYHFAGRMPSRKLCTLLDGPIRRPEEEITKRHKDIAAALQLIYEEALFKILNHVHKETCCDSLVIAGGCGLNSVANGKILRNTKFKNFWAQPDPGDGGTSVGVASYIYHSILGKERKKLATAYLGLRNTKFKNFWAQPDPGDGGTSVGVASYIYHSILGKERKKLATAYLGPSYTDADIKGFLDKNKITYTQFKDEYELIKKTAALLHTNNVVGWFQLGMEWGPRALGARSILANPANP